MRFIRQGTWDVSLFDTFIVVVAPAVILETSGFFYNLLGNMLKIIDQRLLYNLSSNLQFNTNFMLSFNLISISLRELLTTAIKDERSEYKEVGGMGGIMLLYHSI